MRRPLEIEGPKDRKFMRALIDYHASNERAQVYSPSQLASCLRQVFFLKTLPKEDRVYPPNARTSGYFLDGNFRHLKWQFALWKLHKQGKLQLLAVECRIISKRGDHGGTVDALVQIPAFGNPYIVDFKGMNSNDFRRFVKDGPLEKHKIQTSDYGMLINATRRAVSAWPGEIELPKEITDALLIGENKAGPLDNGSPIALHEETIRVKENVGQVRTRLKELRTHEKEKTIPRPECTSTRTLQFQGCPFSSFCRAEIEAIEKSARASRVHADKSRVAVPSGARHHRTRRTTGKRKQRPS